MSEDAHQLGREIERKYLLTALPELPEGTERWTIEQGWLPGEKIRERLRRIEVRGKTRYVRTVKFGRGVERIEVEDLCDPEVFEVLWALTAGCRISKKRYRAKVDRWTWELDVFDEMPLLLAEVELSSADEVPTVPDWLAPVLGKEVTEDGRYTNLSLATHGIPAD